MYYWSYHIERRNILYDRLLKDRERVMREMLECPRSGSLKDGKLTGNYSAEDEKAIFSLFPGSVGGTRSLKRDF